MAKIAFISDLHLETQECPVFDIGDAEAVVFVGDILGSREEHLQKDDSSVRRLAPLAQEWGIPVFLIPGNHEFEGRIIEEELQRLEQHARGTGVKVLYNESAIVGSDPVVLLGTTLWTDFSLYGQDKAEAMFNHCARRIGDLNHLRPDGSLLEYDEIIAEFLSAKAWLEVEMSYAQHPVVVASHFAPHQGSVDPKWQGDKATAWFVNRLPENLIEKAAVWLHGHTHSRFDYKVGQRSGHGHVMCNPYGFHQKFVLDELSESAKRMILDAHPEIAITGELVVGELPGRKNLRHIQIGTSGLVI